MTLANMHRTINPESKQWSESCFYKGEANAMLSDVGHVVARKTLAASTL